METFQNLSAKDFPLLAPANKSNTAFTLEVRLGGYNDAMHYIAHLVKVCILALEGQDVCGSPYIPQPEVNVSSVLELALNMIPYEESELLDKIYQDVLNRPAPVSCEMSVEELNFWLTPPGGWGNA